MRAIYQVEKKAVKKRERLCDELREEMYMDISIYVCRCIYILQMHVYKKVMVTIMCSIEKERTCKIVQDFYIISKNLVVARSRR